MNSYQCHQVLGLQDGATMKDVKSAYRKLALKYHPDKNKDQEDGKKFRIISEAYQTLRADYKKNIGTSHDHTKHDRKNDKHDFGSKKYSWGARDSDKTPQEDWTRYTKYAENAYQDFWKQYEQAFWDYYERVRAEVNIDTEPIQVEQEIPVSVRVDPERCIACCSCETIAPKVFHVEKNVRVNPKSKVINEEGARSQKILDAAHTCPTKAISVTHKDTQQRLYPY
ncbi:MAG: DnaJ domain-containing protein [Thaumarchaeota archaeon]|nr:DnaJ domain-containing protein [Nitrososphaerota archaeon]